MTNILWRIADESVILKASHVYRCRCGWVGQNVKKLVHTGERVCPVCRVWVVTDITGSDDAVKYLQLMDEMRGTP